MPRLFSVTGIEREGRRLPGLSPETPAGQRLVALVNNGEWQSAVDVTHEASYRQVLSRYHDGTWKELALYLIDEERADELEDGRRFLMNGQPVRDPGRPLERRHSA